jgi:anti-sigma-K factor RskA
MSRWTEEEEDDHAVAAEYVLGLLTGEEERAFEARMEVDPPFRALVAVWTEDLARLADRVPEVAPPPRVEAALRRRLFPEEGQGWLRRLGLLPALAGGLVAALLVLWTTDLGLLRPQAEPGYAASIEAQDGSIVIAARYDPATGRLALQRLAGAATPGRSHELWLIAGDSAPVSLGVMPEEEEGVVMVDEALRAGMAGGLLAITDEPPGGSPTGAPSGPPIAAGPLTEA